jgi:Polyprenyltransferase (cytochrome oxidase assembly factor)
MPSGALPRFQLPAQSRVTTRVPDFMALMKPRVMLLAVFTALVGLMIAPGDLDPFSGSIAILTIAAGAGAAGVLNMWYDADIDAVMARTAMRPIPRGTVSQAEALAFGLVLAGSAVAVLALALNSKAAALLAFTIVFLRRCIHSMAEATDASEHRHWRCCRRASTRDWLGSRNRRHRA